MRLNLQVIVLGIRDWETHSIELAAKEPFVHLRIHFPKGVTLVRELELK